MEWMPLGLGEGVTEMVVVGKAGRGEGLLWGRGRGRGRGRTH